MSDKHAQQQPVTRSFWFKPVLFGLLIALTLGTYYLFRDVLTLEYLAAKEVQLRQLKIDHPALAYFVAFAIYVTMTGLSLPSAAVLSLSYGWYFGFLPGLLLVSFAATAGATLAFLMSRYFFRDSIQQRFGERLQSVNQAFEREGAFYLFTLRLIPTVPFFLINALMGLTNIRTWTYWWVSQLGMLPGAILYVIAGSNLGSLEKPGEIISWKVIVAFTLLGVFPIAMKKAYGYFRPGQAADE